MRILIADDQPDVLEALRLQHGVFPKGLAEPTRLNEGLSIGEQDVVLEISEMIEAPRVLGQDRVAGVSQVTRVALDLMPQIEMRGNVLQRVAVAAGADHHLEFGRRIVAATHAADVALPRPEQVVEGVEAAGERRAPHLRPTPLRSVSGRRAGGVIVRDRDADARPHPTPPT